jgi:UDP-N-acetylmuramoyl-tripeptide--D-alanyl-D-alanine ligase
MVELGSVQRLRNAELGSAVRDAMVSSLIVVGSTNRAALRKGAAGGSTDVVCVRTRPEAVALVERRSAVGDVVLFENDLPDHYP